MTFNYSNSDVIAVAAAVIALCSLGATIWQGWIARSHNRRSVEPILDWVRERTLGQQGTILCFSVKNTGVGPAIVKARNFATDGKIFAQREGGDYVCDLLAQVLGTRMRYSLRKHGLPGVGSAIPPGGQCIIAEIEFPGMDKEQVNQLEKMVTVEFTLHYECIYGRQHILKV